MTRYFYQSSIQDFIEKSATNIFGEMSINDDGDTAATQKYAWSEEIEILKQALNSWKEENGEILFEYNFVCSIIFKIVKILFTTVALNTYLCMRQPPLLPPQACLAPLPRHHRCHPRDLNL